MQQLLPKDFIAPADIRKAIIIEFENKKTNVMIKKYGNDQYFNLKNLTHIKRIRKSEENPQNVQFFLRLKDDFNEEVEHNLPEEIKPYALKEVDVAVNVPKTKVKFKRDSELVCSQNKQRNKSNNASFINKPFWIFQRNINQYEIAQFTEIEQQEINQVMRQCIDQAKQTHEKNNKFNACAIYDPHKKKILQFGVDETCGKQNSIKHCVMNVMNLFGQNYIVTAQQKATLEKEKINEDEVNENAETKELPQESMFSFNQNIFQHTIKEKKEDLNKAVDVENKIEEEKKDKINSKRKSEESIEDSISSYYYCTGLDVFIVQEPCIMCSMALIHSRVRRVYYSMKNPKHDQFGGLNEDLMINHMESLNHSFLVFQNVESGYANTVLENCKQQKNQINK